MHDFARRNIPLLRWFYAGWEAVVMTVPIIVFYWLSKGLTMADVLFLQGFYAVSTALLEVPSGYFSDWFARRTTLVLAGVFSTLGLVGYLLAGNFAEFLMAEFCFAVTSSLFSGTFEAMAYESYLPEERATRGAAAWRGILEGNYIVMALYSIVGSLIADRFGFAWALGISAALAASGIVAALSLREPPRVRARDSGIRAHRHFLDILRGVAASRALIFVFAAFAGIAAVNQIGLWYYQPVVAAGGVDMAWMGMVFASFYLFVAAGTRIAEFLSRRFGLFSAVLFAIAAIGLGYAVMARWLPAWGWVGIFAQQLARGMVHYLQPAEINSLVSDDRRATVHSLASLAARGSYAALLFASGAWVAGYPLAVTLWVFAGFAAALFAVVALLGFAALPRQVLRR